MQIHYNDTFNTYESCDQDINKSGRDIFLDGKKLYTEDKIRAMLNKLMDDVHELWDNNADYIEGVHDSEMKIKEVIDNLTASLERTSTQKDAESPEEEQEI